MEATLRGGREDEGLFEEGKGRKEKKRKEKDAHPVGLDHDRNSTSVLLNSFHTHTPFLKKKKN